MIHPIIQELFDNQKDGIDLFSWICEKSDNIEEIEEFIMWHMNSNKLVIDEIARIKRIDFTNSESLKKWANEFLGNYNKRIRELRETSNKVFDRFQHLKKNNFERLCNRYPEQKKRIEKMMNSFLNRDGLLIGKIIFTYREPWFLANHVSDPDFELGSIENFEKWEKENFECILRLQRELESIHLVMMPGKREQTTQEDTQT